MSQSIPQLPRRRLGRTELEIPVIPFGTLGFSNSFGFVSDEDALALIKHAVSLGVNHFDCSRCYGDSMRKLGLALREIPRQELIITGRLCCHSDAPWGGYHGAGEADYSAERAVRDVEDQLELLGTDYFDGIMIHDPNRIEPTLASDGSLAGLLQLKAQGLVRNVGYGMEPHDFHLQAIATGDVDLILCFNDYNLVRRTAADTILPAAADADVGVLNGWAILRGLLTGADIDEVIARRRYRSDAAAEGARAYWNWCREEQVDLLQLAIQFCLRENRIHGNPIGSLNVEQLEANIRAASTPLDESVWTRFQEKFGAGARQ